MQIKASIYPVGVIHGRFQIVHHDHVRYLMAGKALCDHMVIGITNPDPSQIRKESADPSRSDPLANPLTFYERYRLLHDVMQDQGVQPQKFSIVPFPINFPDRYQYYVPMDAVFFLSIYDDWGRRKLAYFQSLGLKTHVLWQVSPEEKGISASDVRKRIMDRKPWDHLVPPAVYQWVLENNIPDRLYQQASGIERQML